MPRDDRLAGLPPILTFQSVMDFTVSTRAIVSSLYAHLPANGSELVLFDVNRNAKFGPLLSAASDTMLTRILPRAAAAVQDHDHHQCQPGSAEVVERVIEAGAVTEQTRALGLSYPIDVFSLSHVALPFPLSDSLYGMEPDPAEHFGINLGAFAARGERGALIVSLDSLLRMSSNPFFPYLIGRIEEGIGANAARPLSGRAEPRKKRGVGPVILATTPVGGPHGRAAARPASRPPRPLPTAPGSEPSS